MPNQYVNKVVIGNDVKLDLTADTVDAAHLAQGYTAHDLTGAQIVGTMTPGGGGINVHGELINCYAEAALDSGEFVHFKNDASYEKENIVVGSFTEIRFVDDNHIITYKSQTDTLQLHEFSFEDGIINSGAEITTEIANPKLVVCNNTYAIILGIIVGTSYFLCSLLKLNLEDLTIEIKQTRDIFALGSSYTHSSIVDAIVLDDYIVFEGTFRKLSDVYTTYYDYTIAHKIIDDKLVSYTAYYRSTGSGTPSMLKTGANSFTVGRLESGSNYRTNNYTVSSSGSITTSTGIGSYPIASTYYQNKLYYILSSNLTTSSTSVLITSYIKGYSFSGQSISVSAPTTLIRGNAVVVTGDNSMVSYITDDTRTNSSKTYMFSTVISGTGMKLLYTFDKGKCAVAPNGKVLIYNSDNSNMYVVSAQQTKLAYKNSTSTLAYGITATSAAAQYDPIQVYIPAT